jgi:hypothetical protein
MRSRSRSAPISCLYANERSSWMQVRSTFNSRAESTAQSPGGLRIETLRMIWGEHTIAPGLQMLGDLASIYPCFPHSSFADDFGSDNYA